MVDFEPLCRHEPVKKHWGGQPGELRQGQRKPNSIVPHLGKKVTFMWLRLIFTAFSSFRVTHC